MTTQNETPAMTIGQLIREKREEKNLSLKVISHQTKIHVGLLELLENNELDKLPSKIYVRGFVKATAKVLGIDVQFALSLLEQAYSEASPKLGKIEVPDEYVPAKESLDYFKSLKNTALTSSSLVAKFFIGFIFIAILGINIKSYLERPSEESKQKLPTVLSTIHQKVKPQVKAPEEKPKEVSETGPATQTMPINIIEDKKEKTAPLVKTPEPVKETVVELPKDEEKKMVEQYLPPKFQILPPKGIHFVFINAADGDSWVTYKVDKAEIKKFVLRQGRTLFLHGELIRLFVGNVKTVKMFYNKKFMNFVEKSGPKNLVFPESLKSQYPDPLFNFKKDGTAETTVP